MSRSVDLTERIRAAVADVIAQNGGGDVGIHLDRVLATMPNQVLPDGLALPWRLGEENVGGGRNILDARGRCVAWTSTSSGVSSGAVTAAEARAHAEAIVRAVNALGERS